MTDSMNFGPEWLRNLSSDGSTAGVNAAGTRYQLAEYRYGREEMLALFEKGLRAPHALSSFAPLYSEQVLPPLALVPSTEEEKWQTRGAPIGPSVRGGRGVVGGPGERGGRVARGGRGAYQPYGARNVAYEAGGAGGGGGVVGWGNGEQSEWSPRKDFNYTRGGGGGGVDNWRRSRNEEDDGWRSAVAAGRGGGPPGEKWVRSSSWREGDPEEMRPTEKSTRGWHDGGRGGGQQRRWDEDHLPEWATENLGEGGGTFDASGAFHGSDDEQDPQGGKPQKEHMLQKSASQQNIIPKAHPPLPCSKSAMALSKPSEQPPINTHDTTNTNHIIDERDVAREQHQKQQQHQQQHEPTTKEIKKHQHEMEIQKANKHHKIMEEANKSGHLNQSINSNGDDIGNRVVDEDFDRLQEDLVLKLVVDEEPANGPHITHSNGVQPPPNMMPAMLEKWFYQDPQGDLQGPFLSTEMAEWFRAGYFSTTLFVRRQCDERFYCLGDLVTMCGGNPFQTTVHIAPLKQELKLPDEVLQYQYLQSLAMRQAQQATIRQEHFNSLNALQQRELLAQQMMAQQQQNQLPPELPYLPQQNAPNPLMQMLSQMQQANKLPGQQPVVDKSGSIPLEPLQALLSLQSRIQQQQQQQPTANMVPIKHENMPSIHGLNVNGMPVPNVPGLPNIPGSMQKSNLAKIEGDNMSNFLQFLQKPQPQTQQQMGESIDLDSLWRKNQYQQPNNQQLQQNNQQQQQQQQQAPPQGQWQATEGPISMWDMPKHHNQQPSADVINMNAENVSITKEKQQIEKQTSMKDDKKNKEFEEKQAKKDADEKRKVEQKKQEADKKQLEDKRKKDEDKIRKELDKAKKEAEEKRQRELAEKRKLKEQRKLEEEARKKTEEQKRLEDVERERLAVIEREMELQRKQVETARQMAAQQKLAKAAPWSQSASNQGLSSLAEIQKLERERKAEQIAMLATKQRLQQQIQEQASPEKTTTSSSMHLNWANKPIKPKQVKSLAEIQAEEQDRLLKQASEIRSIQLKEKETLSPPTSGIWSGQSLTWTNNDSHSAGFWDEPAAVVQKPVVQKQSSPPEPKMVKAPAVAQKKITPAAVKPPKAAKSNKEEHLNNGSNTDEFTDWCAKTLTNMNTPVDIPTFVTFLRDIESALDVREYCRDYLGDKPATQQFANQFLEKRRLFRPKVTTHKDDMCSPAPAITPSMQHNNTDFTEVKGKGKKVKKSKMHAVDARILGFNVTAAQDRINVAN